ncbi:MAG: hypothetical protein ABIL37_01125 [candidate division WOR-3 bacterium]
MILNEIQKAIIFNSSIRLTTDVGFIEIYKGKISNAEKSNKTYGLDALLDIIKQHSSFNLEVLNDISFVTITDGWEEIKNLLFYNENLFFEKLRLIGEEFFKFLSWLKRETFSGIIIGLDVIEIVKEGEVFYSFGVFKDNREFNVYKLSKNIIDVILRSINDLNESDFQKISDIRKKFAIDGSSGVILSYESFEVFENGIRILNLVDNLPINPEKVLYGIEKGEIKAKTTIFLTEEDLKLLTYILDNSLKLLQEKVSKEVVEKAIEKHKPSAQDFQSVINCIKEVLEKAKLIGGTGWIKKNIHRISDGVDKIANEDLKKLLNDLFKL